MFLQGFRGSRNNIINVKRSRRKQSFSMSKEKNKNGERYKEISNQA